MPESVVDQIFARLREEAVTLFPDHGPCRIIRLVGHTPKPDHYTYDAVMEFAHTSERITCKVYRGKGKDGSPKAAAQMELHNVSRVYEAFAQRRFVGVPRPLGDFTEAGAIVLQKVPGLPLQSIIMKAALLPGYADDAGLARAAQATGEWLHHFHTALADGTVPLDQAKILDELETLCTNCRSEGLEDRDIQTILTGAKHSLGNAKRQLPASAVLNDFTPLNVAIADNGVYYCEFAKMSERGLGLNDVAYFMACVEALEKYPFCNREITSRIQEEFLSAYGMTEDERAVVRVLKIRSLLKMFAAGRNVKDTAVRKKVMWANVMKRFIHQAANRTLRNAA